MVLAVLSTIATPQLHVGASPKPLQPPLLEDKVWFHITHELREQEDEWPLDIYSPSTKTNSTEEEKSTSSSTN